jgi:hypothetical protein
VRYVSSKTGIADAYYPRPSGGSFRRILPTINADLRGGTTTETHSLSRPWLTHPVHDPTKRHDQHHSRKVFSMSTSTPFDAHRPSLRATYLGTPGLRLLATAGCGLGLATAYAVGFVLVTQARPAIEQPSSRSEAALTSAAVPPARDAWYLEPSAGQSGAARATVPALAAKAERWYLEPRNGAITSAVPARVADRWYLEEPAAARAPAPASHVADRWYLEQPAVTRGPSLADQGRDTWYLDK